MVDGLGSEAYLQPQLPLESEGPYGSASTKSFTPLDWSAQEVGTSNYKMNTLEGPAVTTVGQTQAPLGLSLDRLGDEHNFGDLLTAHGEFLDPNYPGVAERQIENVDIRLAAGESVFSEIPALTVEVFVALGIDENNRPEGFFDALQQYGQAQNDWAVERINGLETRILEVVESEGITREEAFLSLTEEDILAIEENALVAFQSVVDNSPELQSLLIEPYLALENPPTSLHAQFVENNDALVVQSTDSQTQAPLGLSLDRLGDEHNFGDLLTAHGEFLDPNYPGVAERQIENVDITLAAGESVFSEIPALTVEVFVALGIDENNRPEGFFDALQQYGQAQNDWAVERINGLETRILEVVESEGITREEAFLSLTEEDILAIEENALVAFQSVVDNSPELQSLLIEPYLALENPPTSLHAQFVENNDALVIQSTDSQTQSQ